MRATALLSLLAIPTVVWLPASVPLVWLALAGLPANGPLSPILPTLWDPLLMEAGKYSHPAWVTAVGTGIYLYTEVLNWHVYRWLLGLRRLRPLRDQRWVRWGTDAFGKAPFATVVVFAITPAPFWVVRALAILQGYPIPRFLAATAIGRAPRFFAYAWLGAALQVPLIVVIAAIVLGTLAVVGARLVRGQPLLPKSFEQEASPRIKPAGVGEP